jgi:UrcA family protein
MTTRNNSAYLLHRVSERVSSGAAALALTFAMLLTVDARAEAPLNAPHSITVNYSDVSFVTNEGAAKVYRALKNAARKVCGIGNGAELLEIRVARQECYEATLSSAVQKIDRPTLTAVHTHNARNFG